jgi:uncharacterized small protein (DUF1192 family)
MVLPRKISRFYFFHKLLKIYGANACFCFKFTLLGTISLGMFDDDLSRLKKPGQGVKNLEPLSLDELKAYIVELENEIERSRAEIVKKEAHKNAASAFFKTGQ